MLYKQYNGVDLCLLVKGKECQCVVLNYEIGHHLSSLVHEITCDKLNQWGVHQMKAIFAGERFTKVMNILFTSYS